VGYQGRLIGGSSGPSVKSIKIIGTGTAVPDKVLTNRDLEATVDTSDDWITERTGIKERRIAEGRTATSDLAAAALTRACERAKMEPGELDAIIVGTSTTDTMFPSTACWVQQRLGVRGMPAFDIAAGCSGFLFALEVAANLIVGGTASRVGVCGAEVMSKVVNWKDRSTCVLFGDGAGAAVVTSGDGSSGILASNWGSDGNLAPILYQPAGGTQMPATHQTVEDALHTVHMEGNKVFKHAVTAMSAGAVDAMKAAGVEPGQVDLLIPHQANSRIMEVTRERTGIPKEKVHSVLEKYGNMSAATIPVALDEAVELGRIQEGSLVVMTAFGTGFTWAATVLRW